MATCGAASGKIRCEPVRFSGIVSPGMARGRTLGYPTANLKVGSQNENKLARGVYAGWAMWEGGTPREALINIGMRPTFGGQGLSIEIHILDFSGNLYGKTLEVELVKRLRDEKFFEEIEALVRQIELDIKQAQLMLADHAI